MEDTHVYDEPSEVVAQNGAVKVEGPDSVDVQLTPDAAGETSERLLQASMKARGQAVLADNKRRNDDAT